MGLVDVSHRKITHPPMESETDGNEAFFKAAQAFVDYKADKIRRHRLKFLGQPDNMITSQYETPVLPPNLWWKGIPTFFFWANLLQPVGVCAYLTSPRSLKTDWANTFGGLYKPGH